MNGNNRCLPMWQGGGHDLSSTDYLSDLRLPSPTRCYRSYLIAASDILLDFTLYRCGGNRVCPSTLTKQVMIYVKAQD